MLTGPGDKARRVQKIEEVVSMRTNYAVIATEPYAARRGVIHRLQNRGMAISRELEHKRLKRWQNET